MANMALPIVQVLHMNGGVGETSFANNSSVAKKVMMKVKPKLEEGINTVYDTSNNNYNNVPITCFKVADLGCSCGPNTLLVLSDIIEIVNETSRRLKVEPPVFQFFLNDLFGNDFNSTFNSLPEFYHTLKQKDTTTTCLINATPGNFYGTLFPSNSIHFFHSSFSLHWLSQIPNLLREEAKIGDDDEDKENHNNVYATSIFPASYAEQFKKDFKQFLRSRYEELVPDGGMHLTFLGRYDTCEYISIPGLILMAVKDMVSENLIEDEKLEHFNVPIYFATLEEVREILKEEGSLFRVETLECVTLSWDGSSLDEEGDQSFKDENERAEFITKNKRSVFEPICKAHFGEGRMMDELFLRFKNNVIQFLPKLVDPVFVISLAKVA